jgi:hypothetical protein
MTSRRFTLAGLAVIVAVNAIALAGALYNRSGEPESTLVLTDRELTIPYSDPDAKRENTGLSVRLEWCAARSHMRSRGEDLIYNGTGCYDRSPRWLDSARLAAFGFDLDRDPRAAGSPEYYNRQRPRPAFVVLELAGPAYRAMLEEYRVLSAAADSARLAYPDSMPLQRRAKTAHDGFTSFERQSTRLFAVDAGPSLDELRARYPDRRVYAIVRGTVRPRVMFADLPIVLGEIRDVDPTRIHVPKQFRPGFEGLLPRSSYPRSRGSAQAQSREFTIAFGKRLEPWMVGWRQNPD